MVRFLFGFVVISGLLSTSGAVGAAGLREDVEGYVSSHQRAIVDQLVEAVSIPSVAADSQNIRRKAELLRRRLTERGFAAELLETDGNPLVFGDLRVPGAERTLLLYCHYDGQPVDPSRWQQDDPFVPVLRTGSLADGAAETDLDQSSYSDDWRLYARSASDDTAPIVALMTALDALEASGRAPSSNIKVVFDGEEEAGSPNLVPAIARYRDKLDADLMLIFDGPLHGSDRPTVVYGARGFSRSI